MGDSARGFAVRVDVSADADRVWRAWVDELRLPRWCGAGSRLAARAGGMATLQFDPKTIVRAHIDVFEVRRRLRLIHLPGSALDAADSALVDDVLIEPRESLTVVRLLCSGIPAGAGYDAPGRAHQGAWRGALSRLKVYLDKRLDEESGR
jgi:hypothetical protein